MCISLKHGSKFGTNREIWNFQPCSINEFKPWKTLRRNTVHQLPENEDLNILVVNLVKEAIDEAVS
jgi:hypothetical protein